MHIQQLIGFPIYRDFRFVLFGRKYRVGASGLKALKLLEEAYYCFRDRQHTSWPFALRSIVRQIRNVDGKSTLCFVAANTDNPTIRILAIWLRGHCGGTIGTQVLSQFCHHGDDQTRKEVARALKRMSAWEALSKFARDSNSRIARLASCKAPAPFSSKFERFATSVASLETPLPSKKMAFDLHVELDRRVARPPKSPKVIREILLRIKKLLSFNESYRN